MNTPICPCCKHRIGWRDALRQVLGPRREDGPLWSAACPSCAALLRVPMTRVLLIFAGGIFFGSQTSVLLVLGEFTGWQTLVIRLLLILGFYAIAGFFFFALEEAT